MNLIPSSLVDIAICDHNDEENVTHLCVEHKLHDGEGYIQ